MLLKQLLLFNELHPYASFREAASALQMPESTIRTAIHQLENELHCTLLMTDQRGIHWTPTAEKLFLHTERLVGQTRALYRLPDLLNEAFSQCITIASGTHYGSQLLTELITDILNDYPTARFALSTLDNQTLLQRLVAQTIDFALLRIHDIEAPLLNGTLHSLSLNITPLYNDQICFLVGPTHPLYTKAAAPLRDILRASRLVSKDPVDHLTTTFFQRNGYDNNILQISNIVSLRHLIAVTNYVSWQSIAAAENSQACYHDHLHILNISDYDWRCTAYSVYSKNPTFGERILHEKLLEKISVHAGKERPIS